MESYEKSISEDFITLNLRTLYCIGLCICFINSDVTVALYWIILWWINMCGFTLLWAYTTEPSSFQVPPRRSMRTMRKICRKRMLRRADVAKMFPCVPAAITASDATKTMKSTKWENHRWQEQKNKNNNNNNTTTTNRRRETKKIWYLNAYI